LHWALSTLPLAMARSTPSKRAHGQAHGLLFLCCFASFMLTVPISVWQKATFVQSGHRTAIGRMHQPHIQNFRVTSRARGTGPVIDAEEIATSTDSADPASAPKFTSSATEDGKVAIITGASTGIGLATAEGLVTSGDYHTIILAGRDARKHEIAMQRLESLVNTSSKKTQVKHMQLDLSSLEEVRAFARDFLALGIPLHTLILNAGVMAIPERMLTQDGFEYQFGVNHLAHFLLGNLLLDSIVESSSSPSQPGRIIALSSSAHQFPSPLMRGDLSDLQSEKYSPWTVYGQSKLANLFFAYELDRLCREKGLPVAVHAVHPGVVKTELARSLTPNGTPLADLFKDMVDPLASFVLKTSEEGARTSVRLATSDDGKLGGRYWVNEKPAPTFDFDPISEASQSLASLLPKRPRFTSYDPCVWRELWQVSEDLVGLKVGDVACLSAK